MCLPINADLSQQVGERRDLLRQSLDDAIANSRSEVDDSPTVTLDSVRKTGKRDDFPSVFVSNPRSLKRPRPEEKEKEKEAARDKDLKALEVKIKALEEQWVRNRKEIQALKHKYEEIHVKVEALERELRGGSIYVIRI
jgi:flagellar motility protein MotE (MotC chaperone)